MRLIRDEVVAVDVHWEMIGARDSRDNELPPRRGILNLIGHPGESTVMPCPARPPPKDAI